MDDIEKLLEKYRSTKAAKSPIRTPDCPTDEELYLLCYEDDKDGPLRQKNLNHVIFCDFCATATKIIIKEKIHTRRSFTKKKKLLYPLSDEIDWAKIKTIELFKDNVSIFKRTNIFALTDVEFELTDPGCYRITIDTGQIIWRREIANEDIFLSEKEQEKAMQHGLAASTDDEKYSITSVHESLWNGILDVTLRKRLITGRLTFCLKIPL